MNLLPRFAARLYAAISTALAVISILGSAHDARAAAGRTPGSFAVSPTGAATYTIPIWTQPGPNGLQPKIALTYDSQQSDGTLGIGWSIAGLSSIYRCKHTYAQDGIASAVTLAASDGLCLDGKRLRLTSGTYGLAGSTYQTEVADFSNVTAYGTAGNGPAYFIVKDRNGISSQYGNSSDSQVLANGSATASRWLVNQVSDRYQNSMTVTYTAATGTAVPSKISWAPTAHGSNAYQYAMTFAYGTNVAQRDYYAYVAGTSVVNPYLLGSIAISYGGALVKNYILSYQASTNTGRNQLYQVQECADSSLSNCLLPTEISYQVGALGVGDPTILASTTSAEFGVYSSVDFDGDGRSDLAWFGGTTGTIWVAFGTSTGFSAPIDTGVSTNGSNELIMERVDGTGLDEFVLPVSGVWYYYKWNGSSFSPISTGLAASVTTTGKYTLADVNGDGLPDLITERADGYLYVQLNTTTGSTASFAASGLQTISLPSNGYGDIVTLPSRRQLDFTGSGQQDILVQIPRIHSVAALHFNGSTFVSATSFPTFALVDLGDFNDDGCTDVLFTNTLVISPCSIGPSQYVSLPATAMASMDWDGDGRSDLLVNSGGTIDVYISNGNGFRATPLHTSTAVPAGSHFTIGRNATGDGQDALINVVNGGYLQYYLHNGAGQAPDLMTSIADGYGNSASTTYGSVVKGGTVYHSLNDATYPYINYFGPLYVVSQSTFSDPSSTSGGHYQLTYQYYGAWENLQGRGFSGFDDIQFQDSRTQVYDVRWFRRDFPFTRMQWMHWVSQPNILSTFWTSKLTNTFEDAVLDATTNNQRYFPHIMTSTTQSYEIGGALNNQLISTKATAYTFDNYGNVTNVAITTTDNDPSSPYSGQQWTTTTATTFAPADGSPNWCLNLPHGITTTKTGPGSSITRTAVFDSSPDYANCRVNQVIMEPSSSSYAVTQSINYDAFGNVSGVTTSGVGMSTRTWITVWDNFGIFPTVLVDPVSQALGAAGYETVKGYDYVLGVQNSEVVQSVTGSVVNAPPTSWLHDAFARLQQETLSDGTYITYSYTDCSVSGGCPAGSHALAVTQTNHGSDGTVQTDGSIWYDALDRPVLSSKRLLANGAYERNAVHYDSSGRIALKEIPCIFLSVASACPYGISRSYDALGRPTQIQRPVSSADTSMQSTSIRYDGRTTTTTDSYGKVTKLVRTVVGNIGVSQDDAGYHQNFTYDAFGSLLSITDSLSNTLFTANYDYGIRAFQRDVTDIDLDQSTANGQHRHMNYNALGEVTSWTDAKAQSFALTYDNLSRPLSRIERLSDGTADLTTSWMWGNSAANHNVGSPTVVSANGYIESFSYDVDARVANRSVTIPSDGTYGYDFTYNPSSGLLDTLTYPTSTNSYRLKLAYGYQNGIPLQVSDANAGTVYWRANVANARGQVSQETLGNGVVTNRVYDPVTGLVSSITSGVGGTAALQNESYLFDAVGNVTERQNNNAGLTENFYYDSLYRLDHSSLNGTVNLQMQYDASGNITSRSDVANGVPWTYDANRRHAVVQAGAAGNSYTYDANGNATSRNAMGIVWTSYNHPSSINSGGSGESVQFAYNQDHERWSAIYSANSAVETTFFIGGLLEKVVTTGSNDYRHFIYAGGAQVAIYSRTSSGVNTLRYLREDMQGSVACILNDDGSTYVKESFTAFGARRNTCTWSGSPTSGAVAKMSAATRHGYTWQTALGAMGLNDMNGRIQDATTGRFLSADPYVSQPRNTQGFNRYSYVSNNPLTFKDPSGFDQCFSISFPGGDGFVEGNPEDGGLPYVAIYGSNFQEICIPDIPSPSFPPTIMPIPSSPGQQLPPPSRGPQIRPTRPPEEPPSLPEVCIGAGCSGHSSSRTTSNLLYNWLIQPAFGWIDCAGGKCSGPQELWRLTGTIQMAGAAATGIGAVRAIGGAVNQLGPVAVATGVMQLTPDAITGLATSLDVSGAEEFDQVLLLESVEEGMSETLTELNRALSAAPH